MSINKINITKVIQKKANAKVIKHKEIISKKKLINVLKKIV